MQVHRAELAEFLLSRVTTRGHAAAIVGDLMEIHPGQSGFWRAALLTAAALSRRAGIAVLAATAAEVAMRFAYFLSWKGSSRIEGPEAFCAGCMLVLTLVGVYSAVRRGFTDPVTETAGGLWCLSCAAVFLRSIAWVPLPCALSAEVLFLLLLASKRGRVPALGVLAAGAAAVGGMYASWWLLGSLVHADRWIGFIVLLATTVAASVCVAAALSWFRPDAGRSARRVVE